MRLAEKWIDLLGKLTLSMIGAFELRATRLAYIQGRRMVTIFP